MRLRESLFVTPLERFRKAAACQAVDRPPIWLMRQAGRYLPEYRALKEKYSFLQMVRTPELATEVTLQPLRRYPLDAAILFSDILVVPEAMGMAYAFREQGGIEMAFRVTSAATLARLDVAGATERLAYVMQAIRQVREKLAGQLALLGFCGAPWTLAAYMVDGGPGGGLAGLKALFYQDRPLFDALLQRVTAVCAEYLRAQIQAGVDAVQIFDSWAGHCPAEIYEAASLQWIRQLVAAVDAKVPVILFAKGMGHLWPSLVDTGADVLGVDWTVRLSALRRQVPARVALQGNLDPAVLLADKTVVRQAASELLQSMQGQQGYIFNLGHGLTPDIPPENVEALVATVTGWKNL